MRNSTPSPRRGLTLYEVLLALAIAVSSLAVLSQHLSTGTSAAAMSNLRSEAARLAESKLNEVLSGVETTTAGVLDSSVEGDWTWQMTSQAGLPHVDTIAIEIVVERTEENGSDPVRFTLRRIVRDPALFDATLASGAVVVEGQ